MSKKEVLNGDSVISLSQAIRYRSVAGDGVLVHLQSGRVIVVNEIGLRIVELLSDSASANQLVENIVGEFDVTFEQAALDVDKYLSALANENILQSPSSSLSEQ